MVGQVHLSPKPMSPPPTRRRSRRRKKLSKKKQGRQSRSVFYDDFFGLDSLFDIYFGDNIDMSTAQESKSTPLQNVYFFKRGAHPHKQCRHVMRNHSKNEYKSGKFSSSFHTFFWYVSFVSWWQINTTESTCRRREWTQPGLRTQDPSQNTGWVVS